MTSREHVRPSAEQCLQFPFLAYNEHQPSSDATVLNDCESTAPRVPRSKQCASDKTAVQKRALKDVTNSVRVMQHGPSCAPGPELIKLAPLAQ